MATEGRCTWLGATEDDRPYCRLRGQKLPQAEVSAKCLKPELSTICIDAYSSLARGQDALDSNSTDAFPWLIESATQFENLGETDNAIHAYVKAIDFANKNDLVEKAYDLFRAARSVYEEGVADKDPALDDVEVKRELVRAGEELIDKVEKIAEHAPTTGDASRAQGCCIRGSYSQESQSKGRN